MLYRDSRIEVDEQGISLRWYYFPFGTKRFPWRRIREVREHDMGTSIWGGRWRLWGSGDLVHWFQLDLRRPKKRWMYLLCLDDGAIRPCLTPDDPEAFKRALADHGYEVESLATPYRD